ncbi:MAG TPA: hypothetical protein VLR49_12735 [Ferruginibacter sp.]|nr:hypothetical protein [Ferruginibacter sp.]
MKHIKILLVMVLVSVGLQLSAQTKPAPVKFKPPKLYTQLGSFRDSVTLNMGEAESIIGQPLKIFDDKKGVYSISSYQFLYRKTGVTENEETGKVTPTSNIISQRFKTSPLPQNWVDRIREDIKPGEELFFFDVIAKDAQGRVMYAPNFRVMVR